MNDNDELQKVIAYASIMVLGLYFILGVAILIIANLSLIVSILSHAFIGFLFAVIAYMLMMNALMKYEHYKIHNKLEDDLEDFELKKEAYKELIQGDEFYENELEREAEKQLER